MTCQNFDEVKYHGEVCVVEQVWESDEHCMFCMLRPVAPEANCPGGVYIVDQESVQPLTPG